MNRSGKRRQNGFRPLVELAEERLLLAAPAGSALRAVLSNPPGAHPVRPNTPVLPFGAASGVASFVDPSVRILNGEHTVISQRTFVGPYATLDASGSGFIKIGNGSAVLDNASIVASPGLLPQQTIVLIGDFVSVGFGATVRGPSTLGAFGSDAKPTSIGPNALIDGATIEPGAMVSALARVGPGVTVPAGFRVLPGANVTTNAEASDPSLGKVVPVTAADQAELSRELSDTIALAAGYTQLYQGNSATGVSPGVPATVTGVFNGDLATVLGAGPEPGPPTVSFEPSRSSPRFPTPHGRLVEAQLPQFRARVTGLAQFGSRAGQVAHSLGRSNAIRADEVQPINFASAPLTGTAVTISGPRTSASTAASQLVIGRNLRADDGSVILGGQGAVFRLGDDVTVGAGAVVDRSSIGSGSTIGPRAFVFGSTLPAGSVVPAGTILVNDRVVSVVQW